MWKNTVELGRPHKTKWCLRVLCRIPKATNRHSQYVIFIALPTTTVFAQTCLNVTIHAQCLSY